MSLPQATPGSGGRARVDHFSYWSTDPKQPWTGWIAGPVMWFETHVSQYGTKPCLKWITKGAIECVRCKPFKIPELIGYVPLYREVDGAAKLVIVYETAYDHLHAVEHLTYVRVERVGDKKERVNVVPLSPQKRYSSTLERRKIPVDITLDLLTMWNLNELTQWYRCQPASTASATAAPPPVPAPAEPLPKRVLLNLEQIGAGLEADAAKTAAQTDRASALAQWLKDKAKAGKNGKHDKT